MGKKDIFVGGTTAMHRIAVVSCALAESLLPKIKEGPRPMTENYSTAKRGPILPRQPRLFTGPPQPQLTYQRIF